MRATKRSSSVATEAPVSLPGPQASRMSSNSCSLLTCLALFTELSPWAGADGAQLALPLELPGAPRLRPLSRWQRLIADYSTSGVTVADHVMGALRPRLTAHMLATSAQLARLPGDCSVTVAGLVIARQRPGTAKGTMFLLFEDEWGTINLIVPRAVYERHRQLARAEPLLLARVLERHSSPPVWRAGGTGDETPVREVVPPILNVIVSELHALESFLPADATDTAARAVDAQVHRLGDPAGAAAGDGERDIAEAGADMRAVSPPIQSFAARRR